ncbi:MAG: nucleotide pyrophosphohydrolase [Chloroflexi bacterium]|nr:nucleotide pyrophosphohydrolase [Chloroflexota bacterium]MCY4246106.1 nucleotide pyrophosphohydrolase [Chloroflexota bacterium]
MDLDTLTSEMYAFVESKGWLDGDSPKRQTPRSLAISLALEASEVLEHFQWSEEAQQPEALAEELADVLLYLLQLASLNGIDLGEATMRKLRKNRARDWAASAPDDAPSSL